MRDLEGGGLGHNGGPPFARSPTPNQCITSYRSVTGMPDVGDRSAVTRSDGTVAFAEIDGRPVFGVNGNAPGYTASDEAAAQAMRAQLVERYPEVMATDNLGRMPNNALYHAETTLLLRAEAGGRYLAGRTIEMRVDRELCWSCEKVLPLVGRTSSSASKALRSSGR